MVFTGLLVVLLGTGSYAADKYLGIFDFFHRAKTELPKEAADMISTNLQQETAGNDQVEFKIKEALCDSDMIYAVVEVAAKEKGKYLLLSQMITPKDPISNLGLEGEQTVQEYADSKGLALLYVSTGFDMKYLDMSVYTDDKIYVSDDIMDFMIYGSKGNTAERLEIPVTVCAYGPNGSDMWREKMTFTVQDVSSSQTNCYLPEEGTGEIPNAFMTIHEVLLKKTELDAYIEIIYAKSKENVEDCVFNVKDKDGTEWDNFVFSSGVLVNDDGTYSQKFYYGKQTISDEIMIEPYDLELDYRYEGIVVEKQQ